MRKELGLKPKKKPDALIEGRVFDVYSPTTDNAKNIGDEILQKVAGGQAHRLVLNLTHSDVSIRDLRQELTKKLEELSHLKEIGDTKAVKRMTGINNLKEIIVLDKDGNVRHFYPFVE